MDTTKELRRLLSEATPGEWVAVWCSGAESALTRRGAPGWNVLDATTNDDVRASRGMKTGMSVRCVGDYAEANARLIAALRNAAPALLDVVDAAEEMLRAYRLNRSALDELNAADRVESALEALHAR